MEGDEKTCFEDLFMLPKKYKCTIKYVTQAV